MTTSANKAAGTRWEIDCKNHVSAAGFPTVERIYGHGTKDIGDIGGLPGWIIGCKNEKTLRLSAYMDDMRAQRANLGAAGQDVIPVELVKRRGYSTGRGYAVLEIDELLQVMRLLDLGGSA